MIERICQQCGTSYIKRGRKFCSLGCYWESIPIKIKNICQQCGKEFYTIPCRTKRYCSIQCNGKSQRNKIKNICQQCGKEFYTKPSESKRNKFCSRECKDNSQWKGDAVGYSGLHLWVRKTKPKPNACGICGKITTKLEAANISGEYKRDINDFIYLCVPCHRKFDKQKWDTLQTKIGGNKWQR